MRASVHTQVSLIHRSPMQRSFVLLSLLGSLALCRADAVRLQINNPDGKPVAGAQVRVIEVMMPGEKYDVKEMVSDEKGTLALESHNKLIIEPLQNGTNQSVIAVRIVAPGLAVGVFQLKAGDNSVSMLPGRSVEGVAVDGDGKPAANVGLLISTLPFTPLIMRGNLVAGNALKLPDDFALRTTTDAQGKWKFDSMPSKGTINIEAQDARFKREVSAIAVDQKEATLRLTQGSVIKGRLLKPDGTAAAGVKIYIGNIMENQCITDAQGRFELTGIGANSVRLQLISYLQKLPFLVEPKQVNDLKVGEVRDIGDWKAEAGTKLKGRIISAATKKPVENAMVTAASEQSATLNAQSDKNGDFEITIPSGATTLSVNADGFVNYWSSELPPARDGAINVGAVELKVGQKLAGVIVDETDKPISNVSLFAENDEKSRNFASTGEDGSFSFNALQPGTYTIKSDGLEFKGEVTIKVEIGKAPSLRLVVKDSAGKGGSHDIAGRVIDEDGKPLAGAKVALLVQRSGSSYSVQNVDSEADGSFKSSISGFVTSVGVQSVTAPGFLRDRTQEKAEAKDGNWSVNIGLQKSGTLKGRVVDTGGKAIKGAYVATQSGDELPVVSDENGAFSLPEVPLKNVTLLASTGLALAKFQVKEAGGAIEIALPEVARLNEKSKADLADIALGRAALDSEWKSNWDVLGSERIEQLLGRKTGGNGVWRWQEYLQELGRREPQRLLQREAELRAVSNAGAIAELDRLVLLAKASSTDPALRQQVRTWLTAQQKERRSISGETITRLLGIAQISSHIDAKETAMWLDYATEIADQLGKNPMSENSWQWSEMAIHTSPTALQSLSENWSASAKVTLLANAMQIWLADNDIKAAKKGWDELQKSIAEAAKNPTPTGEEDPKYQIGRARLSYTQLLARTEPKAALALVPGIEEYERAKVFLDIAHAAVQQKQFDVAREALTALSNVRSADSAVISQAAGVAESFDGTFAAPLWTKAYDLAKPSNTIENGDRWYPSLVMYAQERAGKWPGESRIFLEREWAKRLIWNQTPTTNTWDPNADAMKDLVAAMAYLDPLHAIEMTEQVPDTNLKRAEAYGQIGVILLRK
ncbi:carboxypeptidase regulatory-like domain-containing protein [bacterium]|nr:MAG: carboxypeptidase regulatory-like domain-containing protein [bacterium]